MAITKAKKLDIVATLADSIKNATSVVFVQFKGLSAHNTFSMRKNLRAGEVGYYVAKKSLIKRVLADRGYTGTLPELPGEIAVAWSNTDATAPARMIYEHGKKHEGALTIAGGVFENAYADAAKMVAIATIPPLPVLRGMFVNVLNSPIQGLVIALDAIAKKQTA